MNAFNVIVLGVLLILSGMFSGLGLGLMSLDLVGLEIVVAAGEDEHATQKEQMNGKAARRIIPLRKKGYLLLTTLLLGNVAVNSMASILMADMTNGTLGFVLSTVLIVLFGEIIPQALCTRYAIEIGAKAVPFVRLLIALFYVIAKPISIVLDKSLGTDLGTIFTKSQLREVIGIHETQNMIDREEGGILRGAMSYRTKTAVSVMTPIGQVFMLSATTLLNQKMIQTILESGYSRIPVFESDPNNIVSVLHVKDLVFLDPKEEVMLSSFIHIFGHNVHRVDPDTNLDSLLQMFKTEGEHLAIVNRITVREESGESFFQLEGIITLEDVLEEILQDDILDENDLNPQHEMSEKKRRWSFVKATAARVTLAELARKGDRSIDTLELAEHLISTSPVFQSKKTSGEAISAEELARFFSFLPLAEFGGENTGREPIFNRDTEARHCLIILQGSLILEDVGGESREVGPWGTFCADSLIVQEGLYRSDVTVRPHPDKRCRCLLVNRSDFQQLLYPFQPRHSRASTEA